MHAGDPGQLKTGSKRRLLYVFRDFVGFHNRRVKPPQLGSPASSPLSLFTAHLGL
jgi:hypothetical protein